MHKAVRWQFPGVAGKCIITCVKFLHDIAYWKLLQIGLVLTELFKK